MTDPRDFDRRMDMGGMGCPLEMEHRMGLPTPWGWIAGAVFVIVMLALVFTSSESTRMANNDASPAATTTTTAPPAITVPPPETTGQGGQRGQ